MQVEGEKSRVFGNDNRTQKNKNERRKDKRYAGLANSTRS